MERRNEQQYQYALQTLASLHDQNAILGAWRKQNWLDPQTVAILDIRGKPWRQVAVTNASRRALGELRRRGAIVASFIVPTRFHARVLVHAVMTRQQAWRVHPLPAHLAAGRTQVWMDDAPAIDLAGLARELGFSRTSPVDRAG